MISYEPIFEFSFIPLSNLPPASSYLNLSFVTNRHVWLPVFSSDDQICLPLSRVLVEAQAKTMTFNFCVKIHCKRGVLFKVNITYSTSLREPKFVELEKSMDQNWVNIVKWHDGTS